MEEFLMLLCDVCPSLYAVQMAYMNGHPTGNLALNWCHNKLRNDTDIKTVHYNYKTRKWPDFIPEHFQY